MFGSWALRGHRLVTDVLRRVPRGNRHLMWSATAFAGLFVSGLWLFAYEFVSESNTFSRH